ncbi:ABC transporter [Candidatus Woesearchaeota archaeon]|nr:MAG: ABC transporter [Candidatus Woesearchaeota archaeon]
MKPIIHVKNLKKVYKTHTREPGVFSAVKSLFFRKYKFIHALRGVSFDIGEGELVGFIGPNGAGKSTTIKALAGILYPSSGELEVLGFSPWKERVRYVKNIGVVFGQKTSLFWDLPPVDAFYLNKVLYDIPDNKFRSRLNFLIKTFDAEDIVKKPVRDLSLGERMKCEIINAVLHNPRIVFLDEPTIGLDVVAKDKFREFVLDVNKKFKTTFLVTTHDLQDIERLCKRVIIINHGLIVYDGDISKIKEKFLNYKFIKVKFIDKIKSFKFKGCKIIERSDYELSLKLDVKQQPVKALINYLLVNFDVADIVVSDPPIEDVIQKVFRK